MPGVPSPVSLTGSVFFCVCECFAYVHINHHVSVFEVQERVSEAVELEVEMW